MISRLASLVPTFLDQRFAIDKIIRMADSVEGTITLSAIDTKTQKRVIVKVYLERK